MSSDWQLLTLKEIVDFGNGKARPKTEGNIPIYGGNGILGFSGDSNYQGETIIIGRVGAYCGATYYDNKPIWVSDNALSAKSKEGFIPKYAYYVLKSKNLNQYAQGSSHPLLTQGLLNTIEAFVTTNLETQKNIVSIISGLEEKIELNIQANQTLEQIAQALFKSWFVDFDPVKAKIEVLASGGSNADAELAAMSVIAAKDINQLDEYRKNNPDAFTKLARTAALFPAAMQDSEHGEIPVGWEIKQLSEICEVINGRAYKNTEFKTSGTPIVRIQNLSNGGKTVYSDLELSPDKYIESEDFIYAWSATFGPYIWRGPKSIYHYHIWKMEVDESIVSRYFLYLSMFRKTEAMKNAGTGSIFTHLTKGLMESQKILIADNELNMAFSEIVNSLFRQITALKTESDNLSTLRDTLLPELLSGRLAKGE